MATGLRIPVGVDGTGGSATVSRDENDSKIIRTALGDCDSENAFQQDLGLGGQMVFDINDEAIQSRITARLIRIFDDFRRQNRYKLMRDTIKWTVEEGKGELTLECRYRSLESDEEYPFKHTFPVSGQ